MDVTSYILGKKAGGGGGGTSNYNELSNKPQINSIELSGNKTLANLGIQAELTAGSGIDITNNVISASSSGGANVYFIENNSQENPFILSKHDVGVYHFNPRNNDSAFSVYFKVKESDSSSTVTTASFYPNSIFVYNNKIEEEQTFSTTILAGKILNIFVNNLNRKLSYGYSNVQVLNTGRINVYNSTQTNSLSFLNLEETITAKKIFNVLPESSVVPTTDNQLVNKKYVDDQIGNINTILATLTTPTNNGGN